jgi:hypothetical protein
MDPMYGQIAPGGTTMTRLTVQAGIDGDWQPPAAQTNSIHG